MDIRFWKHHTKCNLFIYRLVCDIFINCCKMIFFLSSCQNKSWIIIVHKTNEQNNNALLKHLNQQIFLGCYNSFRQTISDLILQVPIFTFEIKLFKSRFVLSLQKNSYQVFQNKSSMFFSHFVRLPYNSVLEIINKKKKKSEKHKKIVCLNVCCVMML